MDTHGNLGSCSLSEVRTWDYEEIYASLADPDSGFDGPILNAAGEEDTSRLRFLLERAQLLDPEDRQFISP